MVVLHTVGGVAHSWWCCTQLVVLHTVGGVAQGGNKRDDKAERALAQWKAGRKFIELLFNICPAVADIPLQKKHFKKTDKIPVKEKEQYFAEKCN